MVPQKREKVIYMYDDYTSRGCNGNGGGGIPPIVRTILGIVCILTFVWPVLSSVFHIQAPFSKPMPVNGTVLSTFITPGYAEYPFTVHANIGNNYVIKIKTPDSEDEIISFFVEEGKSACVNVPAGEYSISYATGPSWYGEDRLFGSSMRCYKAAYTLTFGPPAGKSGWEMELIQQLGPDGKGIPISNSSF